MRRLSIVVLCFSTWLACMGSFPSQAQAESTISEAQRLFEAAQGAFAEGRYTDAARLFIQADIEAPHPSVIYNAAVSWEQAGDQPRAADAYLEALERSGLDEQQSEEARARLARLRTELGFVRLTRPVGGFASVAHHQRLELPARFFLRPGVHRVLLETESGPATETPITVSPGESLRVELAVPAAAPEQPPAKLPPAPPPRTPIEQDTDATQRVLGWVGIGIGMVASGVAIYMGTQALDRKHDFQNTQYTIAERNAARANAVEFQRNTNLAWGGAALFGSAGAVLLLTTPSVEF